MWRELAGVEIVTPNSVTKVCRLSSASRRTSESIPNRRPFGQIRGHLDQDLIDIAVYHDMHFHHPTERGVVFHLIGALSEFGKLGVVSIGDNPQQARFLYRQCLQVLDEETGAKRLRTR